MQREVLLPHDEGIRDKLSDAVYYAQWIAITEDNDVGLA
jgi:hypothetical protein